VVLVALIALVYGVSLGHRFVFDDTSLVVDNELVELPLAQAHELLTGTSDGISYRPLRIFSYMVDYRIAGTRDPAVFHASNLVDHALATLAVYALATLTVGSFVGALAAAALFAVHPLGSEAVVYVAGRRDLLCTLFVLLALLCWCRLLGARDTAGQRAAVPREQGIARRVLLVLGMVVFAILGMAAKEMAVVLPALAVLLALSLRRDVARGGAAKQPWSALLASAAALLGVGLWLYGGVIASTLAKASDGALGPQPALSLYVLGRYLRLALWPSDLLADYRRFAFPLPVAALDGSAIVALLALVGVLAAGALLLWRGSIAGAGLLWFVVALLPVAQIVPYGEIVSEHNAYLALVGLALAAGRAVTVGARTRPRTVVAAVVVVIVVLGLRSHVRALDWRDDLTLWRATVATAPRSVRGQFNLAIALLGEGELLDAQAVLERARELAPDDRDILLTSATLAFRLGDYTAAERFARRAIELGRDARAYTALGWALVSQGNAPAAIESFETAIELGGDSRDARRGLARARGRGGRL
jgi:tetratricopeptide (TPR) repeat protein